MGGKEVGENHPQFAPSVKVRQGATGNSNTDDAHTPTSNEKGYHHRNPAYKEHTTTANLLAQDAVPELYVG